MKLKKSILILAALTALILSAVATATASASPAWKFNGTELTGKETIVGAAISSSMTIPGVTTECKHFLYNMKISNTTGKGTGEITELPLFECTTQTKTCTVESIGAKKLNWPTHLATIEGKNYIIIEKVEVEIVYGGELCVFEGLPVIVKGSAGGLVENSTQTATFNKTTFTATGTSLKFGSNSVEWNGLFPTEPFETHREQTLEVA
jgi:hypothetical protein